MPLPPILPEGANPRARLDPAHLRRREVLRDTDAYFSDPARANAAERQAQANLARWRASADAPPTTIQVIEGDWGDVTQQLTRQYGRTFAVLNMANAHTPGGGCDEGMIAQEENMYRRTDCRRQVSDTELSDRDPRSYNRETTELVNGQPRADGTRRVAFDRHPRVCIKGPETDGQGNGYAALAADQVFPFYELKAAAIDRRRTHPGGEPFEPREQAETRGRIAAQLDTLIDNGQRDVVLSAFGCGAFANPANEVAQIYQEELARRSGSFDTVAFAIFYPGFGPRDNFEQFHSALHGRPLQAVTPAAGAAAGAGHVAPKVVTPNIGGDKALTDRIIRTRDYGARVCMDAMREFFREPDLTRVAPDDVKAFASGWADNLSRRKIHVPAGLRALQARGFVTPADAGRTALTDDVLRSGRFGAGACIKAMTSYFPGDLRAAEPEQVKQFARGWAAKLTEMKKGIPPGLKSLCDDGYTPPRDGMAPR